MRIMQVPHILRLTGKKINILGILVIVVFLWFNFFGQKKQTPLQFAAVKKQDIKSVVSASGTLTGKNTVNLKFKSSGKLSYINVKTGDRVYAGQVIAGLDTRDISIQLQQAENALRDKQASVDKVLDDIHLFQYGNGGFGNVGSGNETMTQRQLRTTAEVARDNAFDSVRLAQQAFADAVIVSPISGIVTQAIEVSGQTVGAADVIARIVDTASVYLDADIDEADIERVVPGLLAEVTLDAYPGKVFGGAVEQMFPQTRTTLSGAIVVTVRIRLIDPGLNFVNGLTGQASIITAEVKNAFTVPQEALREDNSVMIQTKEGIASLKKVVPGIQSDTDVEIREGLDEGEKVLLNR